MEKLKNILNEMWDMSAKWATKDHALSNVSWMNMKAPNLFNNLADVLFKEDGTVEFMGNSLGQKKTLTRLLSQCGGKIINDDEGV